MNNLDIAYRLGGDGFVVLIDRLDTDEQQVKDAPDFLNDEAMSPAGFPSNSVF